MNQYTIVISENADFWNNKKYVYDKRLPTFVTGHTTTEGLFKTLLLQKRKRYMLFLLLNQDSTEKFTSEVVWNVWEASLTLKDYLIVTASPLIASEIIFSLMDKMPLPGSYFLEVDWHCKSMGPEVYKSYTPLLGVLKKLKLWHQAEINLLTMPKDTLSSTLELIAQFLSANIAKVSDSDVLLPSWNESCIWKGALSIDAACNSKPKHHPNFHLVKHSCQPVFYDCLGNNEQFSGADSSIWFGNTMKALELIDTTTIPLMLLSGNVFLLQCNKNTNVSKELQRSLASYQNVGMLCRLACICTAEPFSSCSEVSSDKWKETVLTTPSELYLSSIKLCQQPQNIHFVVTAICKETCSAADESSEYMSFHAHALQILDQLDATLYFEQEYNSTYSLDAFPQVPKQSNRYSLPNASSLQSEDQEFGNFFRFVLNSWKKKNPEKITPSILQSLILDSSKVFKQKLLKQISQSSPITRPVLADKGCENCQTDAVLPEITSLKQAEQINIKHVVQQEVDRKVDSPLHCNDSLQTRSTGSSFIEDILNRFEKLPSRDGLQHLHLCGGNKTNNPSVSHLTDFSSAIATSYHGINFNIDAQGSEKKDRQCRRLVEKLVKYETFSVGSKAQVPSPLTAGLIERSPTKPNRTPGKKKKLAKVAEKLYKKRNSLPSTTRLPSNTTFKTPTKQGKSAKQKVLLSPSVHKMSLRSSTPTKALPSSSSKRNLFSQSQSSKPNARKHSRKLYVQDNKKKLQEIVVAVLAENSVEKNHAKFSQCVKRLYRVSMAFLKDLRTSKDLENRIKRIVRENVDAVLSFEVNAN